MHTETFWQYPPSQTPDEHSAPDVHVESSPPSPRVVGLLELVTLLDMTTTELASLLPLLATADELEAALLLVAPL
jgi:hypothetical protein